MKMPLETVSLVICILCAGCSRAPSVSIIGSFFPIWMICVAAGVVAAFIARAVLVRCSLENYVGPGWLFYPATVTVSACMLWEVFFRWVDLFLISSSFPTRSFQSAGRVALVHDSLRRADFASVPSRSEKRAPIPTSISCSLNRLDRRHFRGDPQHTGPPVNDAHHCERGHRQECAWNAGDLGACKHTE